MENGKLYIDNGKCITWLLKIFMRIRVVNPITKTKMIFGFPISGRERRCHDNLSKVQKSLMV